MRSAIVLVLASVLAAACATPASETSNAKGVAKYAEDARLGEETRNICFASNIDSFGNTTRDTFTVRNGSKSYLIEVYGGCPYLRDAERVAIGSTTTSCLQRGDRIIVSDSISGLGDESSGLGTHTCTVKAIYDWDPKAKPEETEEAPAES